jgi:hypothetical protein
MDQRQLRLRKSIACYFPQGRSGFIPANEIVELTSIVIDGKVRVHWSGSKEGMGFVMVDGNELESCAEPI